MLKVRNCLPPSTPSNGHMTCSRGYVEGSECTVTCNKGYELQDNSTLTCLETELWNSVEPTCEGEFNAELTFLSSPLVYAFLSFLILVAV